MTYTKIRVLSDKKMLDYYVWLLLPEDERGNSFEERSLYDQESDWDEKILSMAYEKDPSIVPFYRVLIERAAS